MCGYSNQWRLGRPATFDRDAWRFGHPSGTKDAHCVHAALTVFFQSPFQFKEWFGGRHNEAGGFTRQCRMVNKSHLECNKWLSFLKVRI
jgi:hypothetical protein